MRYDVKLSNQASKALKKIDIHQASIIISWIEKNLSNCSNPRLYGKALIGNKRGFWRYRVGAYRIIADIQDDIITIEIINVSHRSKAYQ